MPLLLHEKLNFGGELGLWSVKEPEEWFRSKLELIAAEEGQLGNIKGRRRTDWLAVRYLVHQMSGRLKRGAFLKDEFGKPHLEGSNFHISVSHSGTMAAAIAGPASVGIDIQNIVAKIVRIEHKFMRQPELQSLKAATRIPHLHVYWGAKEALYKAYGRRQLDFCEHILIEPFEFNGVGGTFKGRVLKEDFDEEYLLTYRFVEKYILVYAWEEKSLTKR